MAISTSSARAAAVLTAICVWGSTVFGQTAIKPPKNKYTPEQDVKLGLEAAAEVRQQYPVIKDEKIAKYLGRLGDTLVANAPNELKHPAYQYSFTPVNLKEINAFALPGGPMFVNRGMFEAAAAEGEVVGVMAHELAHVLLRHGTANASKAQNPWMQLGQLAGQVGGAMLGGAAGSAIAQGSQFGLGTLLLRYGRDFEKQADLLGAQIMAKAGYDPRALGRMFETIAAQSKGEGGTPQWMSSHPNPGNRSQYIAKEAEMLTIGTPADEAEFAAIKTSFAGMPAPASMSGGSGGGGGGGGAEAKSVGTPGQPVPRPTGNFREISAGGVFKAAVPADWTPMTSKTSVRVVPQNGYGPLNGQTVFTYGLEFGITKAPSRDLQEATKAWLQGVAQNNPQLKLAGQQQQIKLDQRSAIATPLVNPSPLGGQEQIVVYTTFLADGTLFYYFTLVPENDAAAFQETFKKVAESIRFTDVR
jgi:Zn-dependent protease with chaperone function